jgi:hypothetical protein
VDPVPDPLLLRKCGSARNRTRGLWIGRLWSDSAANLLLPLCPFILHVPFYSVSHGGMAGGRLTKYEYKCSAAS